LIDIPKNITKDINFIFVKDVSEVLKNALVPAPVKTTK